MTDDQNERDTDRGLRDGLRVSQASFAWTVTAGTGAVAIGAIGDSLALIAFGLIGLLDGIGSGSLIIHFRHSQRHEGISERHERLALLVITIGMATIGIATIADSAYRLDTHATSDPLLLGIVLAGVSVLILVILAVSKHRIAPRVPSHALHADGWVSAMGAVFALLALVGTALDAGLGWWWIDPLAAIAVACGAVGLGVVLARGPDLR